MKYAHGPGDATPRLERRSETELHRPRLERDVRVVLRLPVVRRRLVGDESVVVRVVERVEHLDDAVEGHAAIQLESLLQAHVDAMQVGAVEAVARDERAVAPYPVGGTGNTRRRGRACRR